MNTRTETYGEKLALALRLRDIPGRRIGEILAEVDSHVAETEQDPQEAFGSPSDYADRIAGELGHRRKPLGGFLTWSTLAIGVPALVGGVLLSDGVRALGAGTPSMVALPGGATVAIALALFVAVGAGVAKGQRRSDDRLVDPRTGEDSLRPAPRWTLAVLIGAPVLSLVVSYLLGRSTA